jgi:hypothetical protein
MKTDISKTTGHDFGMRRGREVGIQALCHPKNSHQAEILQNVAQLLNEAGYAGATVQQQVPISRLLGYVETLGLALDYCAAFGVRFDAADPETLTARINLNQLKEST